MSLSARWLPTKPAPPVIRIFIFKLPRALARRHPITQLALAKFG
jgi:hypothetical protein